MISDPCLTIDDDIKCNACSDPEVIKILAGSTFIPVALKRSARISRKGR